MSVAILMKYNVSSDFDDNIMSVAYIITKIATDIILSSKSLLTLYYHQNPYWHYNYNQNRYWHYIAIKIATDIILSSKSLLNISSDDASLHFYSIALSSFRVNKSILRLKNNITRRTNSRTLSYNVQFYFNGKDVSFSMY
jgi:hypothetical protein